MPPLYEYQCQKCQNIHEEMQKFSDPPLVECPQCAGPLVKIMSLSAFSLKGSGWYTTDYKKPPVSGSSASSKGSKDKESAKSTESAAAAPSAAPGTAGSATPAATPSAPSKGPAAPTT